MVCLLFDNQAHLVNTVDLLHQQVHHVHEALDHGDSWLCFSTCIFPVDIVLLNSTDLQLFGNPQLFAVVCE